LLDIFRDHDISYRELSDIHEEMLKGKVLKELANKMPESAVTLIEKMVQAEPSLRPSLLEVLTD